MKEFDTLRSAVNSRRIEFLSRIPNFHLLRGKKFLTFRDRKQDFKVLNIRKYLTITDIEELKTGIFQLTPTLSAWPLEALRLKNRFW